MDDGVRQGCANLPKRTAHKEVAVIGEELWQEVHRLFAARPSGGAFQALDPRPGETETPGIMPGAQIEDGRSTSLVREGELIALPGFPRRPNCHKDRHSVPVGFRRFRRQLVVSGEPRITLREKDDDRPLGNARRCFRMCPEVLKELRRIF